MPFTGNTLSKEQTNFLINLIKNRKTKNQCNEIFMAEFGRKIDTRNLSKFARRYNLYFQTVQDNSYSVKEESILKGLWLVNANNQRKVTELTSRGVKSMRTKLTNLKLTKQINEELKNKIKEEINSGKSLKDLSKHYNVDLKYINEFARSVNKETVEVEDIKSWTEQDLEELVDIAIKQQEQTKKLDSEQSYANIKIKTDKKYIALTIVSDFHLENANTDLAQLKNDFKIIAKTPNFFAGFNGDLIDNFLVGPHKQGATESVLPPKLSRMLAGKLFDTVKDKMLWMVLGCHDSWDKDYADYDLPQHLARKIMVPYIGTGGDINLKVNEIEYFIHSRHKYRGSSGIVNGTGCCKKILQELDPKFDIVAVSHNHISEIKLEHFLGKLRCFVRTGSYKREDRYSKMLGFRSNEFNIQIPVIILNTQTKEMKIISGIQNAADLLIALNK